MEANADIPQLEEDVLNTRPSMRSLFSFSSLSACTCYLFLNRLVGVVVKESVSRAADSGFDSHLRRGDFLGSCHDTDLKIGALVATLPGTASLA